MVGNPYKSRKKNTMENQESRAHSRGFNLPDDDAESNATEAAVATSAAVKERLTSIQESVFVELVLSVHRFHATANTIASFAQKVVEYWNREHFSRMMRGQPGLGGVLPDEIARSRIAAQCQILRWHQREAPRAMSLSFFRSQALVHRPAHKSQYALQKESLHLLAKHKNSIRPLQRWEFEQGITT